MEKNVEIIKKSESTKYVLINNIRFKGKKREEWKDVEEYLKKYIGKVYEVKETSDKIYISSDFPDEYANSESRIVLKGPVAKAKANVTQAKPELISIAESPEFSENSKKKHERDAKYGWYKYSIKFALPVYNENTKDVLRYNVYRATMLVRHAEDKKKYLYDIIGIKKETSSPPRS